MKITGIKVHSIYNDEPLISNHNSGKNNWDIKVSVGIDSGTKSKEYIATVCIDVLRLKHTKKATIKIFSQYLLISDSPNFKPLNDTDYYFYADIIKTSLDHARIIVDVKFKNTEVEGDYLQIDPIQKHYADVKNGHIQFLN